MTWQRATQPEQKDERRAALLDATRRLLDEPPHDPSLRTIAKEAKLAASGIYRYFSSREALFLAVLAEDLDTWTEELCSAADALPAQAPLSRVATALASTSVAHPRMIRQLGRRAALLERASSVQEITEFRVSTLTSARRSAKHLQRMLPTLSEETMMSMQLQVFSIMSATSHLLFPAEVAREAALDPRLRDVTPSFYDNLRTAALMLLHGACQLDR